MNWDRVEGNWKQFTGNLKAQWGKLTDDDLTEINGNREVLEGKLQERYGYAKDEVKRQVDTWSTNIRTM
ncbi:MULTISPECIES: CsbD family protein [Xanthobacter]|uniref:CsbD family protein n=1 Tax=Xanthobacter aminoxidans TaxID=186280 RepID=A0ABW6ZRM8_9HYPH|nr:MULTISPECIES: CsbD family protein [Xanthobacter]MCL8384100.1 CsbD family protein [Xanthobacter aminoxidans]